MIFFSVAAATARRAALQTKSRVSGHGAPVPGCGHLRHNAGCAQCQELRRNRAKWRGSSDVVK